MNWNEQSCSYSAGPAVERSPGSSGSCQNGIHWDGASSNSKAAGENLNLPKQTSWAVSINFHGETCVFRGLKNHQVGECCQ